MATRFVYPKVLVHHWRASANLVLVFGHTPPMLGERLAFPCAARVTLVGPMSKDTARRVLSPSVLPNVRTVRFVGLHDFAPREYPLQQHALRERRVIEYHWAWDDPHASKVGGGASHAADGAILHRAAFSEADVLVDAHTLSLDGRGGVHVGLQWYQYVLREYVRTGDLTESH